jgi:hypothetical protein
MKWLGSQLLLHLKIFLERTSELLHIHTAEHSSLYHSPILIISFPFPSLSSLLCSPLSVSHAYSYLLGVRTALDHATMLSLLSSRCSASTAHAPHSGISSGSGSGSGTSSVRSLLLFYSQIVGDYPTLVAEYVAEGSYRAAIGARLHPPSPCLSHHVPLSPCPCLAPCPCLSLTMSLSHPAPVSLPVPVSL